MDEKHPHPLAEEKVCHSYDLADGTTVTSIEFEIDGVLFRLVRSKPRTSFKQSISTKVDYLFEDGSVCMWSNLVDHWGAENYQSDIKFGWELKHDQEAVLRALHILNRKAKNVPEADRP